MIRSYEEYDATQIIDLPEKPKDWSERRFRHIFKLNKGLTITKENLADNGVPCVNYGEIHSKCGFQVLASDSRLRFVDESYLETNKSSLVNAGELIFADTSEDKEGSGNFTQVIGETPVFAGYHTIIAKPKDDTNPRFLAYFIDSREFRSQIQRLIKGVKVFSITNAILKNTRIVMPEVGAQAAIASFLDAKTSEIDSLIAEKQNFIKLLEEKRQALISHVVTKGLDDNVKMKASGVEWIGDVPEHWEIKNLKFLFKESFKNGVFKKSDDFGKGNKLINVSDIFTTDDIVDVDNLERVQVSESEIKKYRVYYGDIFFVRSSLKETGIAKSVCYLGNDEDVVFECHVVKGKPNEKVVIPTYLIRLLNSSGLRFAHLKRSTTATMTTISQRGLSETPVPLPPVDEQAKISEVIETHLNNFFKLTKEVESSISLLKERRSALISAAVTGKIDVREYV